MGEAEKVDGKYFFWLKLPMVEPKNFLEKLLFKAGFVSRGYVRLREEHILKAYNQHIFETVIGDRKALLRKLREDREAVGEGLMGRISHLEVENLKLKQEFEEFKKGSGGWVASDADEKS